jgi:short-subunit dehydrogenase
MKLHDTRVLLTGAAGGIGSALAERLAARGAALALVARTPDALAPVLDGLHDAGARAWPISADLLDPAQRGLAIEHALHVLGGIDVLINCAGLMSFRPFAEEDPVQLERMVQLNLVAPMLLTRAVLPDMLARGEGRIVNVGSTFGSIGFAWFAAYSASKFGLRGLSEALRRELEGSGVGVTYVAPRAVRTRFNSDAVYRMARATRMKMDDPGWVADRVIAALETDAKDVYLGFPESLFARLNSVMPRLVDSGLRKQNRQMAPFARGA